MTRTYFELIESLADGSGFKQSPLVPVVEDLLFLHISLLLHPFHGIYIALLNAACRAPV